MENYWGDYEETNPMMVQRRESVIEVLFCNKKQMNDEMRKNIIVQKWEEKREREREKEPCCWLGVILKKHKSWVRSVGYIIYYCGWEFKIVKMVIGGLVTKVTKVCFLFLFFYLNFTHS
jgi:hypothetical protein